MAERLPDKIVLETPRFPRLPRAVAARIDAFYELRELRKEYGKELQRAEKVLSALKHKEDEIAKGLAKDLRKLGGASKVSGETATFAPGSTDIFIIEDWDAYEKHIQDTGDFELLERRPGRAALKERLADEKLPPGVKAEKIFSYSLTKVGGKR